MPTFIGQWYQLPQEKNSPWPLPCEELDTATIFFVSLSTPHNFVQKIKLHLFLGKSTKTAASRVVLSDSDMHQIDCRLRFRPRLHWGSVQHSPDPLAVFRGTTSKGWGEEWKGREGREFVLCPRKTKEKSAPFINRTGLIASNLGSQTQRSIDIPS